MKPAEGQTNEGVYRGDPLQRLVEIEEIKQLKARYFRFIDTQRWDDWGQVFTDDATFTFPSDPIGDRNGRSNLVAYARGGLDGGRSAHHGHAAEIELTSPTTARGTWAMFDFVEHRLKNGTRSVLTGAGHYHEDYIKQDGGWRIASMRLERLRVDTTLTTSDHLLQVPSGPASAGME